MARFFCLCFSRFWWEWYYLEASKSAHLYSVPVSQSVTGGTVAVIVPVDPLQPLHLLDNLHGVLLYKRLVRQHVLLLGAAVEVGARQDVRDGPKPEDRGYVCKERR